MNSKVGDDKGSALRSPRGIPGAELSRLFMGPSFNL